MSKLFKQFLKNPFRTGSLLPSSETLAKEIVSQVDFTKNKTIVEFGPGTGSVTSEVLKLITDKNLFFTMELNSELVVELNQRFPKLIVYNDTAVTIEKYLRLHKLKYADIIISSIPVTLLKENEQQEILDCIIKNLSPNGEFVMYMYIVSKFIKSGQRFEQLLEEYFPYTTRTKLVWNNFPPAFIYKCRKKI